MVELKDELLTVAEAATLLKVTPHTIYRWIANGRLPAVRYSRRVLRVRKGDLKGVGARPVTGGDMPEKGTVAALFRHFGVISKEEGEEMWRTIKEARDASVNDPVWSFDEPS